jgi:transposase
MGYRHYPPPTPLLFGYDPVRDLPKDHLARFVDQVVDETVVPPPRPRGPGQPPFDPRLCLKVLTYGYATGIRSSRLLERLCQESLPYLFLTRGDAPCYRTLCSVRVEQKDRIEQVWVGLFAVAEAAGMKRLGHVVIDSTKLRADASPEAVLSAKEYASVREELARILAEAEAVDAREEQEGRPGQTRLGTDVDREQMRDVLRRVRRRLAQAKRNPSSPPEPPPRSSGGALPESDAPAPATGEAADPIATADGSGPSATARAADREPSRSVSPRMRHRLEAAVAAIDAAHAAQQKHLCLTDPDARMMAGGRDKKIQECHSFEVAVDREAGLLVAAQTSQEPTDNTRLEGMVAAAGAHEPDGVKQVDADSGYFCGGPVGRLLRLGMDLCVPDSSTAGDLHRGEPAGTARAKARGQVEFRYDPDRDRYQCPEGNVLRRVQTRVEQGQRIQEYRAQRCCLGCPLAESCLTQRGANYRTVKVGEYAAELAASRERFNEAEHRQRYRHRGEAVETVFGVIRGTLGYVRWLLRGRERVACEGRLMQVAYQVRKIHGRWQAA